ncbi:MAG: lysophospholipid acyltransferase family protein [Thermodesulfobacteriota bacterium]|nr:lysophospholipid acyltransferase family protein [Thermodesulfobacteriota bacterium]
MRSNTAEQDSQPLQEVDGFANGFKSFVATIRQRHIFHVSRFLGTLVYVLDRRHRRIVRRNVQFTHPEWSRDRIRALSRHVFQNMAATFLEICQISCFSCDDILRRVQIRGEENLLPYLKNSEGVILISAHLGNWEMAHLFASCYLQRPLVLVARRIESKGFNRWINGVRARYGNVVLNKKRALPKMVRALQQGRPLGLLIDQGTKLSRGVEVRFFGQTTTATPAAALLARRYNIPVVPAFCVREADARLSLLVEPPVNLQKTEDPGADLKENTQRMTLAIEEAIRSYPEQWLWLHKRWKRHHPYLYAEDIARRQRRKARKRARSSQG